MKNSSERAQANLQLALSDGRQLVSVSASIVDLLGYPAADFQSGQVELQKLVHPHDDDMLSLLYEKQPHAEPRYLSIRMRDCAGKIQCLKATYTKVPSESGIVLQLFLQNARGLVNAAAEQGRMSNFSSMMDNTEDYIYFKDRNHVFTGASQTLVQITRPAQHWSDLIGLTDYDVFPEELADAYYKLEKQVFQGIAVAREEQKIRTKEGVEGWVDNRKYPIKDESGSIIGLFGIARDITEKKNAAQERQLQYELINGILNTALDGYWLVNSQGRLIDVNAAGCAMLGYTRPEMLSLRVADIEMSDSATDVERRIQAMKLTGGARFESRHRHKDGSMIDVEVSVTYLPSHDSFSVFLRNISERKKAEKELFISATTFNSQEGILITDANKKILKVNAAFTRITGYGETDVIGKDPHILSSARHDHAFFENVWESIHKTGSWQGEIWNRRKSGEIFPEWQTITAVKNSLGVVTNYVATFSDITLQKAAEDEIIHLAFYDPLTKLPNRRLLNDRLQKALEMSSRNKSVGALMFIDLDNFKTINDTLGHHSGDLLLEQVAIRLLHMVREVDTVARMGGDEFVILLQDLGNSFDDVAIQSELIGKKILATLSQPYALGSKNYRTSCSVGITVFSDKLATAAELLKEADLAMYEAKASGRNALRFYDAKMHAAVFELASKTEDLREALTHNQFILFYQPQLRGRHCLTGAEALIRWQHPVRGLVSPAEFINLAEETGLILSMGRWVLQEACSQLARWAGDSRLQHLHLAVNVSIKQFRQEDFVQQVADVLLQTGANPRCLKFELTESLMATDMEDIIAKMASLKLMGIRFSLDDFGTGYSSLSYLKRLPFDQLKIAQEFVLDIQSNKSDLDIAKMITGLSKSLGIEVIAEGVENEEVVTLLAQLGCDHYQGFFFGRPMNLEKFETFAVSKQGVPELPFLESSPC